MFVCRLNSTVECIPYHLQLTPENALQLVQQYPQAAAVICQWLKICHKYIVHLKYNCLFWTYSALESFSKDFVNIL